MDHLTDPDRDLADLLVKHRPEPDDAVVRRMERNLFGRPARAGRRRTARLVLAFGGGVAAVAAAVSLVTGTPFSGGDAVQADPSCRQVVVEKRELQPTIVVGADGTPRVEQRMQTVRRTVKRCR